MAKDFDIVRWEDPPPPGRGHAAYSFGGYLIARTLKNNPGKWAVVAEWSPNTALANHINKAHNQAFRPAGAFEAVRRIVNGVPTVYARYVGGDL
jgi:hypothetical protein